MQKKSRVFSLVLVTVLLLSVIFPAAIFGLENNDNNDSVDRIYGADRYETALNIAKAGWSDGAETVVLAPGTDANLVDALTAAPLAKSKDAPILLTQKNALPAATKAYIQLKTKTVYVVSGAIGSNIIAGLEAMDIEVIKLGGNDRFETATNIAKEIENVTGVFLTTAKSNADALSVASIAAAKGMPILLTNLNSLPTVEAAYLDELQDDLTQSYVIGGTAVVADSVKAAIPGEVTRVAGANRFSTNLEVLNVFFADVVSYDNIYVANGTDTHLVDALVGSTLAAATNSPIVMVNKDFDANAQSHVAGKLSPTSKVIALGGEGVVAPAVQASNYVRAEDFGVMQISQVNGYTVGFNLKNKDLVSAVEVSLYKGNTLLAKNVSTNKLFSLNGPQFSTPFNINGDYPGDAYWRYGEWNGAIYDVPTKAVITVYMMNGKTYTAVNTNLTGDPQTLLTEDEKHVKAEDFGVMQLSGVNGYSVGFSLIDGKDASDLSAVEVSLYDKDEKLLAKNTATYKLLRLTATQLSSPFNIDGSFQADGYWNYGAWNGTIADIPAKAVIKVTYESNGRTYTVTNTKLTGEPSKLGPTEITTDLDDQAMVNVAQEFAVETVANRYAGEVVRVKATLTEGVAEGFELMYQENDEYHVLTFTDGVAWYGPEAGFPLADAASNFKINFTEAGTYGYKLEVVRVSDNKVLASATNSVEAAVTAPVIESDLGDQAVVNVAKDVAVETTANSYAGEAVRVKVSVTEGDPANLDLQYEADGNYHPMTFDENNETWYGAEAGFPLADTASNFKVNFKAEGNYTYTLEIVRVEDGEVLGSQTYQVEAAYVDPAIQSDLGSTLVAGTETAFSVATVTNSDLGSTVRVKITVTDGDAANVALLYQEGDNFLPLTFDENGMTWFGPESGFTLADTASNFKVTFAEAGSYSYKLEIVSGDEVIGEANYTVEVTEAPAGE